VVFIQQIEEVLRVFNPHPNSVLLKHILQVQDGEFSLLVFKFLEDGEDVMVALNFLHSLQVIRLCLALVAFLKPTDGRFSLQDIRGFERPRMIYGSISHPGRHLKWKNYILVFDSSGVELMSSVMKELSMLELERRLVGFFLRRDNCLLSVGDWLEAPLSYINDLIAQ